MDVLSLSILLSAILLADEILNQQLKVSKRLLQWLDQWDEASKNQKKSTR